MPVPGQNLLYLGDLVLWRLFQAARCFSLITRESSSASLPGRCGTWGGRTLHWVDPTDVTHRAVGVVGGADWEQVRIPAVSFQVLRLSVARSGEVQKSLVHLKQQPCHHWLREHIDPADTILYLGIDASERARPTPSSQTGGVGPCGSRCGRITSSPCPPAAADRWPWVGGPPPIQGSPDPSHHQRCSPPRRS
jgi:hypothetical protein